MIGIFTSKINTNRISISYTLSSIRSIILFFILQIFVLTINAQCPNGALPFTNNITTINNGQVYCASSNVTGVGNLTIKPGGTLIVTKGITVNATGTFTIDGELILQDEAAVDLTDSISLGFTTNNDAYIKLGKFAHISMTGSLNQYDVTQNGVYPTKKAQIEMNDWSTVEVCGTYTHSSTRYYAVKYVGITPARAYF